MENLMVKSMAKRYEEYLSTHDLITREAKSIYYFVMSTLESIFWRFERLSNFAVDLYANEDKIVMVLYMPSGKEYKFEYYSTNDCSNGKLSKMLYKFVEIFNNINYPLTDKISSPVFYAYYYSEKLDNGTYKGCYRVHISVEMLTNVNNNPEDHAFD